MPDQIVLSRMENYADALLFYRSRVKKGFPAAMPLKQDESWLVPWCYGPKQSGLVLKRLPYRRYTSSK